MSKNLLKRPVNDDKKEKFYYIIIVISIDDSGASTHHLIISEKINPILDLFGVSYNLLISRFKTYSEAEAAYVLYRSLIAKNKTLFEVLKLGNIDKLTANELCLLEFSS